MQQIANQSNMGSQLFVYICNFDLPALDIRSARVPPPPEHLETVLKVSLLLPVILQAATL